MMELESERVVELEAYLTAVGLKDYKLTQQEQKVLDKFESEKFSWGNYYLKSPFARQLEVSV